VSALPIVSDGDRLLGAPWRFVATAEQTFPHWKGYAPYLRADFVYSTAQTGLLPSQDPRDANATPFLSGLPITRDLNLRAGMRWSGIDLSLFANNVTNDHPDLYDFRFGTQSFDHLYLGHTVRPLTLGITGTYRY